MVHDSFITTTRGLRRESLPMRLFEKAKRRTDFAMDQFTKRFTRIEKAREMSIAELHQEERRLFEEV